jgi:hypothetical protein
LWFYTLDKLQDPKKRVPSLFVGLSSFDRNATTFEINGSSSSGDTFYFDTTGGKSGKSEIRFGGNLIITYTEIRDSKGNNHLIPKITGRTIDPLLHENIVLADDVKFSTGNNDYYIRQGLIYTS